MCVCVCAYHGADTDTGGLGLFIYTGKADGRETVHRNQCLEKRAETCMEITGGATALVLTLARSLARSL